MTEPSWYQKRIAEIVGTDVDPGQVEAWMRLEHDTLDGLPSARFAAEARIGARLAIEHPGESVELATSLGLAS